MTFPVGPWLPVLMVSVVPLSQSCWAGQLPPIPVDVPFWASSRDVPGLISAGLAAYAPSDAIAPAVEPAYTAHGTPGFAAGTSNSSGAGLPVLPFGIDGGHAPGSGAWTIGAGSSWQPVPSGDIDGGNAGADSSLVDGGASAGGSLAGVSGGTSAGGGTVLDGGDS
jgi:hypothetical protein